MKLRDHPAMQHMAGQLAALGAPRAPHVRFEDRAAVRYAYRALALFAKERMLAAGRCPLPVADAPNTYPALLRAFLERPPGTRTAPTPTPVSSDGDFRAFSCHEDNYWLRLWHDWHRVAGEHAFSTAGELAVAGRQLEEAAPHCAPEVLSLLVLDTGGQLLHRLYSNEFVADQGGFALAGWDQKLPAYVPREGDRVLVAGEGDDRVFTAAGRAVTNPASVVVTGENRRECYAPGRLTPVHRE